MFWNLCFLGRCPLAQDDQKQNFFENIKDGIQLLRNFLYTSLYSHIRAMFMALGLDSCTVHLVNQSERWRLFISFIYVTKVKNPQEPGSIGLYHVVYIKYDMYIYYIYTYMPWESCSSCVCVTKIWVLKIHEFLTYGNFKHDFFGVDSAITMVFLFEGGGPLQRWSFVLRRTISFGVRSSPRWASCESILRGKELLGVKDTWSNHHRIS